MKALKNSLLTLALVATSTSAAFAADGLLDETSTGTSNLQITTTTMAEITSASWNFDAGSYTGAAGVDSLATKKVCVYTNEPAGEYTVTAKGNYLGDGSASDASETQFWLKRASSTDTIEYSVYWNKVDTATNTTALVANAASATMNGATPTYPCSGNIANFQVKMTHNNIMSKPAGVYSGVLSLLITPAT